MKYEIGDKVINIKEMTYLSNPFHYKKVFNCICTVKSTDGVMFSIYDLKPGEFQCIAGADRYKFHRQEDGSCFLHSNETLYHLEKDKVLIIEKLESFYQEQKKECDDLTDRDINFYKDQIKTARSRIKQLKEEGYEMNGHSMTILLNENKEIILQLINKG